MTWAATPYASGKVLAMKNPTQKTPGRKSAERPTRPHPAGDLAQAVAPGITQVEYTPMAPRLTRKESIHPRRILPRVREGKERQFHSSSRQTTFVQAAPRAFGEQAATDELSISINCSRTSRRSPAPGELFHLKTRIGSILGS